MVYALWSVKKPLYRLKTYETVEEWRSEGGEGKIVFETNEITDVSNFRICGKLIFCSSSLDIPEGITSIGRGVFINEEQDIFDAWEIDTVNIPASVQIIEDGAFVGADELEEIIIHPNSPCGIVKNNGLYTKDGKTLLYILDSTYEDESKDVYEYVVPDGTERIACNAFTLYLALVLPESVKEIGDDIAPYLIRAPKGSYAIQFAQDHGIEYEEL